ncbi:MAG: hypothetical protein ACRD2B_03625 [Terriglobia bacterium]
MRALDIDNGELASQIPQFGDNQAKRNPGVLATAGGLLFYGNTSGDFVAVNDLNGKPLWYFPTNGLSMTSPMTYTVSGKQYVALAIGPNVFCFGLP